MSYTIDIAQLLNKQDNDWIPAEGYVLVWEARKVKHQAHAQVLGDGQWFFGATEAPAHGRAVQRDVVEHGVDRSRLEVGDQGVAFRQ